MQRFRSARAGAAADDKIIISGASGQLGGLTVKALLAKGVPAKNLILVSRTPDTLAEYAKLGAVTRFGDFSKPESLPAAYAGGTRMLLISIGGGAGPRPEAHKRAIDAAVKAGVKQIAYTSWIAISKGDTTGLSVDHLATEEMLKKSGVAYTFLRNSIYMDGAVPQAAKVVADGRVTLPANEYKPRLRHARGLRSGCRRGADHSGPRQQGVRHHGPGAHRSARARRSASPRSQARRSTWFPRTRARRRRAASAARR